MTPRKNPGDEWLPPRVYRGRTNYELHPKGGGSVKLLRRPADGVECPKVKAAVWEAYTNAINETDAEQTMSSLVDAYHKSTQFKTRAKYTRDDYTRYSARIKRVFGHMLPAEITAPHIRKFMDALAAQGKEVTANRHHSYLSVVFAWGVERDWLPDNPASKVRKFREAPRDRYVEDWEMELVKNIARSSAWPWLAPFIELSYLCRGRSGELRGITEADLLEDGVYLNRSKGSLSEITGYSDRLVVAIKEAKSLMPDAPVHISRPLFHNKKGAPLSADYVKKSFGKVRDLALKNGLKESFTLHDVKAKGVTDHAKNASGHKTKKMEAVYNRKPGITESTR